ncbi:DegV family protein [Clostridium algidicarnis]|uniref:DegV family protein n=1 Tax=Clostridium algidicarnis TaxID=37659 RepID=UPI001C0DDB80|nr:DegV family protein [Clostridium algidicarnis]MBU3228828.1 DegV family protein [Clostridium algidicarnis]MBU3252372.1 DegV family protein [Clostridium algidicarnis]
MDIVIITDSSCDLPLDYINDAKVSFLGLISNFKGNDYVEDFGQTLSYKAFYDGVRNGEMPTTSQINSYRFFEEFEKHVKENKSIIYLAFSSALSGTYNSSLIAKSEILEKYPDADITIIDTRSASLGVGLIVYHAYEMLNNGSSKDEIISWVEDNKLKVNHFFTVDDLNHLKRGGRISPTSAFVGTILDIKPILYVNDLGELIPFAKVKGRKKAIRTLFDNFKDRVVNPEDQIIFISHGDCLDDALFLKSLIEKEFKVKGFKINFVGQAIGSHSGPGILTLFFIGNNRSL